MVAGLFFERNADFSRKPVAFLRLSKYVWVFIH